MTIAPAPKTYRRLVWTTLVATLLVIAWGALVRATKSGAGCGDDWPHCNGQAIPLDGSVKTLIEFTHRVTSGAVMLLALAVAWAARKFPKGPARSMANWALGFMLMEAALGAGLVLFGLVVDNDSVARAVAMSLHLLNTLFLLGAQGLCIWFAEGGARVAWRQKGRLRALWFAAIGVFLLLGVTGALTALGDTLFPVETIREGIAQHMEATHPLLRLRVWHPVFAIAAGGFFFLWAVIARRLRPDPTVARAATAVQLIYVTQLFVGVINLVLLAPVWMQLVHLFMADLSWLSVIFLGAATLAVPAEAQRDASGLPAISDAA